eukprot:gene32388-41961_t
MGEGETTAPRAPRSPTSTAPSAARAIRPDASTASELAKLIGPLLQMAEELDESRVQRAYRNWAGWIEDRAGAAPLAIALAVGDAIKTLSPTLATLANTNDIVEIIPREILDHDRNSPRYPVVHPAAPAGLRLIVIGEPAALADDLPLCGWLRRECVAVITAGDSFAAIPRGLFTGTPMQTTLLQFSESGAGELEPAPAASLAQTQLTVSPGVTLEEVLDRVLPRALWPQLRSARQADDLARIAQHMQTAQAAAARHADGASTTESARAARSEEARLTLEHDLLNDARGETAGELKSVLSALRFGRSELDAGEMLGSSPPPSFLRLIQQLEVDSTALPTDIIEQRRRRDWWSGTPFRVMGGMLNKKFELQVKPEALREALKDVHGQALRAVGVSVVRHVNAFNDMLDSLALTYPGAAATLQAHRMDKVYPDNFMLSTGVPPPGGLRPETELSLQIKSAAEKAFAYFAETEARSFRIERERKGFLGQLTEARSAVFGIYFLLLMGIRAFPGLNDFSQQLQWGLMGMIAAGFVINLLATPRQERVQVAERVETKLEELRTRLVSLVERFVRDQLGLLETVVSDRIALIDADLGRAQATTKARLEGPKGGGSPLRSTETGVLRPRDLHAEAMALAIRLTQALRRSEMASLAILLAAAPFRAVTHLTDGRRLRVRGIDDAPVDTELAPFVFVDSHGAEVGRRAGQAAAAASGGVLWRASPNQAASANLTDERGNAWSGKALFALLIRRIILAAERTAGEAINQVTLITPSGLEADDSRALEAAAHLAGAVQVTLEDVGKLIVEAPNSDIGERHLLVQFDADQMRVSLFRSGASGAVLEVNADLSDEWSGAAIADRLAPRVARAIDTRTAKDFIARRLPDWPTEPVFELVPDAFQAPGSLLLPVEDIAEVAARVMEQVRAVITLRSVDVASLNWVHLHGRWATGLRSGFESVFRRARILAADSPGAVLELASLNIGPRPTLTTTIFADHPAGLRIPNPTVVLRTLLNAGAALPAAFIEESFPTQHFYDSVGLFARDKNNLVSPLGEIALPRLFEKRAFGLLKVRVTADTDRFLLVHAELAMAGNVRSILYDKTTRTADPLSNVVMRTLKQQELPAPRPRMGTA